MAKDYYPPWFSYMVFGFTRDQIIWAIANRYYFDKKNKWPPEPPKYETDEYEPKSKEWVKVIRESSYVDIIGQTPFKPNAYFISPKTIWAEISRRLKPTKTDGQLLIKEIESMARPTYEGLEYPESRCALNYISLLDFRKRPPYWQWRQRWMYYRRTGR